MTRVERVDARPGCRPARRREPRAFAARAWEWLDEQATLDGRAVAITHGGVVKAAVIHALHAPIESFWRIDASPLAITELHAHHGRWTVTRANAPLPRGGAPRGATTRPEAA